MNTSNLFSKVLFIVLVILLFYEVFFNKRHNISDLLRRVENIEYKLEVIEKELQFNSLTDK